jgi:TnpA family transposase
MPRIRNWNELTLFRPDNETNYLNVNNLFEGTINWKLIESHWQDLMQVVLSIKENKLLPSTIHVKLMRYTRKNKIFLAMIELGKVIRTLYLLDFIMDPALRIKIHQETNKVEEFNGFLKLLKFGGQGPETTIDPVEQEKRVKYSTVLANAVMIQNVMDLTKIINELNESGTVITDEVLKYLSPYLTKHIKRFGIYSLNKHLKHPEFITKLAGILAKVA